ncbi:hypothetical protein F4802DRAFT_617102 [Xylaria palmicola]|nr:hypothetical protein F4802DRAFT_617102 [Xylaria palmicola]
MDHQQLARDTDTAPITPHQDHGGRSPLAKSPLSRSPLSNRANIDIDKADTNWEHKDSSEGPPSTHDSVCDAAWISTSDLAKSPYQTPGRPATPIRSPVGIDLDSESPLSRFETPFLYGYGTELAPILEQRSIATLRTIGSRSTSDLSSLLHDAPGALACDASSRSRSSNSKSETATATVITPTTTTSPRRPLRRRGSLDLNAAAAAAGAPGSPLRQREEAEAGPQLRRLVYSRPTVHLVDVYAYPRRPVYPPPQRPATPPSLRRIPRPRSEGDAYIAGGGRIAYEEPGFRAPRSGHGSLASHPFMMSPQLPSSSLSSSAAGAPRVSARRSWSYARTRRGEQQQQQQHASSTTTMRRVSRTSRHDDGGVACTDTAHPASLPETVRGACKRCHRPRDERWSLGSTLVGHGPGARHGADWCGRCACRKIARGWCCGG